MPADEIEQFVVGQIRSIGRDPALAAEVASRAQARSAADQQALRDEQATLRKSLRQAARQVADCVGGPDAPRRLADLQDRIRAGQNRLDEIAKALTAAGPELTTEAVTAALAGFDGTWQELATPERCRLLSLLIERITYDGETIAVSYRPNGIMELPDEHDLHD